jgi:nitroimidazol reductase NimA-like FMN-containing flavoprotein (pyridoxamine 5'-phosphate oxidase superfamily)
MEVLDQSECWRLLRTQDVGRLSVVVEGEPDIFPVNYVVDHGSIVIRTAAGRKLAASVRGAVAFEVDELHGSDASGWSVVLRGRATEIRDKDEVMAVLALGLVTWHVGRKPRFLRLVPWATTGRRLRMQGRPSSDRQGQC